VIDGRISEPRDRSAIAAMIQRIDGLNDKLEDLLLFARPKPPRLQPVDVKALMRDVATSASISTGRTDTPIPIAGDELKVRADPEMLRAAMLNLLLNACQAAGTEDVDIQVAQSGRSVESAFATVVMACLPRFATVYSSPSSRRAPTALGWAWPS
jgi:nitrogen fixation/metabolism regulation signal transduction histidine kinase